MSYQASPTHQQSCPGDAMGTQTRLLTPKDWQPKQAMPGETVCWMRHARVACQHMVVILPPSARTQGNSACFGAARGAVTPTTASALTLLLCFVIFLQSPNDHSLVTELLSFWKHCLALLPTSVGQLAFKEVNLQQGKRSRVFIRSQGVCEMEACAGNCLLAFSILCFHQ